MIWLKEINKKKLDDGRTKYETHKEKKRKLG